MLVLKQPVTPVVETTTDELEAVKKTVEKLQAELERKDEAENLALEQQKQEASYLYIQRPAHTLSCCRKCP